MPQSMTKVKQVVQILQTIGTYLAVHSSLVCLVQFAGRVGIFGTHVAIRSSQVHLVWFTGQLSCIETYLAIHSIQTIELHWNPFGYL